MTKTRALALAGVAVLAVGLAGCATPESSTAGSSGIEGRHQHMRDAKQGFAASTERQQSMPAKKPLHDHREWK